MASKFIINDGYGDKVIVEGAETVRQVDGFFYFAATDKTTVYIQSAGTVRHIKRVTA